MNQNLKMYILVNKDIKIGKGKLAGQVGHAVNVYIYHMMNDDIPQQQIIHDYMNGEIKKIILYDTQEHLEKFEQLGFTRIRDKGYTQLEPNTLTCINLGILDSETDEMMDYLKTLKLV
jgi:PTH2 family peptidyl-tRNA hydrolase